ARRTARCHRRCSPLVTFATLKCAMRRTELYSPAARPAKAARRINTFCNLICVDGAGRRKPAATKRAPHVCLLPLAFCFLSSSALLPVLHGAPRRCTIARAACLERNRRVAAQTGAGAAGGP